MNEIVLQLEGKTNDLLQVCSPDGMMSMKTTRLFKIDPDDLNLDQELVDISVTSTNSRTEHPLFDRLLDKTIRLTVEIID